MPWIPLFVDDSDAVTVVCWLSAEPEIAFLLSDGPKRWKAVKAVEQLPDRRYGLWQHTGEALWLLREWEPDKLITNPWDGWHEQRTGKDPTTPFFGAGHPSVFWLNLWARHEPYSPGERSTLDILDARRMGESDMLSLSGFEWIGDRYQKAPICTHRCWRRLKSWVSRSATKLKASGQIFWAFPSALAKLRSGMEYSANGFDLSDSLQALQ